MTRFLLADVDAAPVRWLRVGFSVLVAYWVGRNAALLGLYADLAGWGEHAGRAWLLGGATGVLAIALAAGVGTRVIAPLLWLGACLLTQLIRDAGAANAGDTLIAALAFPLALAGAAGHLARGRTQVPAWGLRLVQLQVVLIYVFAGLGKAESAPWADGTALSLILANPADARFAWAAALPATVLGVATLAVVAFELYAMPVLVWPRHTRHIVLACGVALHVGIMVMLRIPTFSEAMLVAYLAWLTPGRGQCYQARA